MSTLKAKKIIDTINKGIALNPTEIKIKQTKKVVVDGAFEEVKKEVKLKVLIYLEKNKTDIKITTDIIGSSYSDKKYCMIADYKANLQVNSKNAIEFDCKEGHMKMKAVYPIAIEGTICGYQVDLERIG
ncbi:hypothetical protein NZ45_07930 [Clostridium botulinum]|uniref:DUF1934 domain-containing protein n=1 Tax=Clostridium botulinum TaxID=1491 RepID=A0ABD7CG84_CLOBO|nr:hypothetical protein [Clostridium botulinum]KGO14280.1 hypothetical protein NZ45_07930 [Clostridium botulinum]QRI52265.1 hypothetical protein JQS73_12590 [Clostridium botulinum]